MHASSPETETPKVSGEDYVPKVPPDQDQPELTLQALGLGVFLSVVFGAANAYLGLKVGMTVSASIPAAVIGMGVFRGILKRGSLLETNMVQTTGSAGESLAAGVCFTVPAMIMLARDLKLAEPGLGKIFAIAALGGLLGVLFMIPLRYFLMVQEHQNLPFPEGTACAEVLTAGQEGGQGATTVFLGLAIGAVYKLITYFGGLFKMVKHEATWHYAKAKVEVGIALEASLLGVGFILGARIGAYMLAGAVVGWLVFIPAIAYLGAAAPEAIFPGRVPVGQMSAFDIWNNYIRYIGAGAVAFGGVLSLLRAVPMIFNTLRSGILGGGAEKGELPRTQRDLDSRIVFAAVAAIALAIWKLPTFGLSAAGVVCLVFFTFFFTTVSARIVGIVGSSSNPASGMTIATLLATALVLKNFGYEGTSGMMAVITIGAIVCIGICIGGDTSQDLKTGFLVGATPWRQQIGELIGTLASAATVGWVLYTLDGSTPLGSAELPAPQASLVKLVVQGIMEGNLPWTFVGVGAAMGAAIELLGIGCLPFAVGLYLPFSLSSPIMIGGLIRLAYEKFLKEPVRKAKIDRGILLASGLIAGEAMVGVILAGSKKLFPTLGKGAAGIAPHSQQLVGLGLFAVLCGFFLKLYFDRVDGDGDAPADPAA